MQFLSLGLILGAASPTAGALRKINTFADFDALKPYLALFIGVLAAGQAGYVLGCWVSSKLVARPELATFGSAAKVWIAQIVFVIVITIGFALLFPLAVQRRANWALLSFIGGAVLFTWLGMFIIPMKIYAIGFWRSFLMMFLAGISSNFFSTVVIIVAAPALVSPQMLAQLKAAGQTNPENARLLIEQLTGKKDSRDEIDRLLDEVTSSGGQQKPLPEKEAAVVKLQALLQARQRALPPGDTAGAAGFQRQLDRYLRFLETVNAERRAQRPSAWHHFPVKNLTSLVA